MKLLRIGIITCALGLVASTVSYGQAALMVFIFGDKVASEKFHLSLDAGLNLSSLPGLNQKKTTAGFYFGLGTYLKLNDKWALTPEFKPLSPAGAKGVKSIFTDITIQDPESEVKLNYMDIPVLLQYNLSERFSVAGGPQISFLTSAKQETSGKLSTGQEIVVTEDIESIMEKTLFSIPLQLAYSLSTARGGKGIDIKVRYNIALQDAFSNTELVSSRNSTLQFFLSFPFINPPAEKE